MMRSDEELKKENPELYRVAREAGTERPFSGKFAESHEDGIFRCAVCENPLFSSENKFDSGTGWPSFDEALPDAVEYKEDNEYGMKRVEVVCRQCKSHLGHVFDDGPKETTGKRYCMNSVCLDLKTKQ